LQPRDLSRPLDTSDPHPLQERLYFQALQQAPDLASALASFDAFTDIEFNPKRSWNCQARSAARFVALERSSRRDQIRKFDDFVSLYSGQRSLLWLSAEMEPD